MSDYTEPAVDMARGLDRLTISTFLAAALGDVPVNTHRLERWQRAWIHTFQWFGDVQTDRALARSRRNSARPRIKRHGRKQPSRRRSL